MGGPFSTNLRNMYRKKSSGGAGADYAAERIADEHTPSEECTAASGSASRQSFSGSRAIRLGEPTLVLIAVGVTVWAVLALVAIYATSPGADCKAERSEGAAWLPQSCRPNSGFDSRDRGQH